MMKWEELAWELLQAPAQDAVRLAFADSAEVLEVLGKLDLRALVECERKPGGLCPGEAGRPDGPVGRAGEGGLWGRRG